MNDNHQYILFGDIRPGYVSAVSFKLVEMYLQGLQNRKKWKNDKKLYTVAWQEPNGQQQKSKPLNYRIISSYIRANGYFDYAHFNLPWTKCFWLDFSLDAKINWHKFDEGSTNGLAIHDGTPQQQYGDKIPLNQN